jgi:hypothetical protein
VRFKTAWPRQNWRRRPTIGGSAGKARSGRRGMKIILSYRRADSAGITGRIFDRFLTHFGPERVFMDIDNIPFGIDFREHIKKELGNSDVVLVIMGQRWLNDGGVRRIDNQNDLVRIEVETALQRGIPVIPVLVDGATMPQLEELPDSLHGLVYRNAAMVDSGRDFHVHMDRLIRSISRLVEKPAAPEHLIARPTATPTPATLEDVAPLTLRPHETQGPTPASSRDERFETPLASPVRDAHAVEARPIGQRLNQIIVIAGCAVVMVVWSASRYVLTRQLDDVSAEMARTLSRSEKIEIERPAVPPPLPPPPPRKNP